MFPVGKDVDEREAQANGCQQSGNDPKGADVASPVSDLTWRIKGEVIHYTSSPVHDRMTADGAVFHDELLIMI